MTLAAKESLNIKNYDEIQNLVKDKRTVFKKFMSWKIEADRAEYWELNIYKSQKKWLRL